MQIDSNMNVRRYNAANAVNPARTPTTGTGGDTPEVSLEGSAGLDRALASVPDVRPEAVSRAKALIADPNYPSARNLKQLSGFLAQHLLSGVAE
jgi:hypothetical protein